MKAKRTRYIDGWHEAGYIDFFVENGRLIRGVMDGRTVYPYRPVRSGGMDNVSGVSAYYGVLSTVEWF